MDSQYESLSYPINEIEHQYGSQFHILSNPYLLSLLADLCSENTHQPRINELISRIYHGLLQVVINAEFGFQIDAVKTRMAQDHPKEGVYQGPLLNPEQKAVSVNLARAGTVPSQIVYSELNYLLNPKLVRQDHIGISRQTNKDDKVTGSEVSGHKIGGDVNDSIILFPDPMGATGGTLVEATKLYEDFGKPKKVIALHCIVTPEYIRKIQAEAKNLIVYAVRLDRGLSSPDVLKTTPGTHPDQEVGLNEKHYIVPGGGGFGEILNNSFV